MAEELGADPGAPLRRLHQQIPTDAEEVASPSPAVAVVAGDPAVTPRQLPAPPESFIGRHDELEQLDLASHRSSTAVVVCAVAGVGGVGKTWLAVTWAHRHLDRFPDGQLFVDLRGFSPDPRPMEPAVAVRGFLDALGVPPDRIP
ncbi:hypothetical protein [Saccharothrix stipae]